jgi:PRTRC genetic system protein B
MNTSVSIGSSQDFKLSRVLLVYGTSSYDSYPYRHPFLTIHNVVHESDGARLEEGQLVTPQMLVDLMTSLGRSVPLEILPERVIVRTSDTVVWWTPARRRIMFFSDRGSDPALKRMNGKVYPHPALLFKVSGIHLWVRALRHSERPRPESKLCIAPYWNTYDDGAVCSGSMRIPQENSVAVIDSWEHSFFKSEFTHASGTRHQTNYRHGVLALWKHLQGKNQFPAKYLIEIKQSLAEFVNHDDRDQRQPRQGH